MAKKKTNKKQNKKINTIKKNIMQVILLSLIIFIIILFAYQIISLVINPTDSFIVKQGTISQAESLTGYVIRDEKVIETDENQTKLIQIKNEGEKVALGETIFRYEAANEQELNAKIEELNTQIQTAMEGQEGIVPNSDIKALEKQIENRVSLVRNKNNIQQIKEYKTDINGYITKKAKISGELSPSGAYINNLISERINTENQLRNSSKYETAQMSGIVSYRVDGLEDVLTIENFDNIDSKLLQGLDLTTGQIVTTSNTKSKIINNFVCYIAIITNSEEAKKAEVGDKIEIKLSSNQEIPAEIVDIKQDEKGIRLILKITQEVEFLSSYRKISLDVIWWEKSGLRVPNSSIIYENGLSYVIRKKAEMLSKVLVKIVKENDNYSIITSYKTEELKNMGYTIQEINNMRTISIYDEILTDPDLEQIDKSLN